jgi:hypothetical protein
MNDNRRRGREHRLAATPAGPRGARASAGSSRASVHANAIVATARQLAILFQHMLTRGDDYTHLQPSLTRSGRQAALAASRGGERVERRWEARMLVQAGRTDARCIEASLRDSPA